MKKFWVPILSIACIALAGCTNSADTGQETTIAVVTTASETSKTSGTEIIVGEETIPDNDNVEELDDEEVPQSTKETLPPEPEPDKEGMAKFTKEADEENWYVQTGRSEIVRALDGDGLPGVRLNGWTVAGETYYSEAYRYEATLTLDVAESDNPYITQGTAEYMFIFRPNEGNCWLPVRKTGELNESLVLPSAGDKRYADFCNNFTLGMSTMFPGEDVTDFSAPDLSLTENPRWTQDGVISSVSKYCPSGSWEPMSYGLVDEGLQTLYGFSADALDIKNSDFYDSDTDTVSVPGHGGSWYVGLLTGDEVTDSTHVLTIDYFEDGFFLQLSQTYRYTFRENADGSFTMLRMERLYTSDRGIMTGSV